jgi:hypothetical protein
MKPLDFTCSHFDVATNLCCMAQPGESCVWPNAFGTVETCEDFHPERIEAAAAINDGPGETPTVAEFDRAVDAALGGAI